MAATIDNPPVAGLCPPRFEAVRAAFAANLASGEDIGASVAATLNGQPVIDLWGGWIDAERTRPWAEDTITCCFSSTKTATALAALILADRGELDVDAPIQRYWPQFQDPRVTTRHALQHTAGLPSWDEPMTMADLYDWEKSTTLLARQTPWWEPGQGWGYHAVTQGVLVGEVVRRITGRTLGAFVDQEICAPLSVDFHIGTSPEHDARISPVFPSPPEPPPADAHSLAGRMARNPTLDLHEANGLPWRRAELPAGNGFGNARALARMQAVLACQGETNGRRFLSPEGCLAVLDRPWTGGEILNNGQLSFGLGYALNLGPLKFGPGRSCYWGGAGGSLVVVDFETRLTFAYVMNRLKGAPFGDRRNMSLITALYAALAA